MSTYVIGDLQGCFERLTALLSLVRASSPDAQFVFVGDIVNRGPQSLATLRQVRALGTRTNMVLGNHDLNLLAVAHNMRKRGRSDTLDDILGAPDRAELLDWLRRQPLALERDGHLIVHAGVLAPWTVEKTLELAREVELVLQGPDWLDLLANMYGSLPDQWDDRLRGHERLRCIINALTRMRYCRLDGSMDFSAREDDLASPAGLLPWFEVPGRLAADDNIVYGHWSAMGLNLRAHVMGIDTGCVWGGKLTALRLDDRTLVQVDCPQYQKPGK